MRDICVDEGQWQHHRQVWYSPPIERKKYVAMIGLALLRLSEVMVYLEDRKEMSIEKVEEQTRRTLYYAFLNARCSKKKEKIVAGGSGEANANESGTSIMDDILLKLKNKQPAPKPEIKHLRATVLD